MRDYRGVLIPTSAEDWELYEMPGAAVAANKLTAELLATFDRFDALQPSAGTAAERMRTASARLFVLMEKYDDLGACDTEPKLHARQALSDYAKMRVLGTTEFCASLEDALL